MQSIIESALPLIVTARSVELGNISLATWIDAPVASRISFIFEPPLPIRLPHCVAGTIRRMVIGGLTVPFGRACMSCTHAFNHKMPHTHLFEFFTNHRERLINRFRVARDGDNPFRTRPVGDVYFSRALQNVW
jgi:hypothetical protein